MLNKLNRTLNNLRYCEEVHEEGAAAEAAETGAESHSEGLLNAQPQEPQDWSNFKHFNSDKYKDPDQQLKAYNELHSRFGGFTGAPDDYSLPEGVSSDNEAIKEFMQKAQSYNMNQEIFDDMLGLYNEVANVNQQVTVEGEMSKLGDKAGARIQQVNQYLQNNFSPEVYQELDGLVTTAESIQLVEKLIGATAPAVTPADTATASQGALTMDYVNEKAFAEDEHGNFKASIDPEYERYVNGLYEKLNAQQRS